MHTTLQSFQREVSSLRSKLCIYKCWHAAIILFAAPVAWWFLRKPCSIVNSTQERLTLICAAARYKKPTGLIAIGMGSSSAVSKPCQGSSHFSSLPQQIHNALGRFLTTPALTNAMMQPKFATVAASLSDCSSANACPLLSSLLRIFPFCKSASLKLGYSHNCSHCGIKKGLHRHCLPPACLELLEKAKNVSSTNHTRDIPPTRLLLLSGLQKRLTHLYTGSMVRAYSPQVFLPVQPCWGLSSRGLQRICFAAGAPLAAAEP